MATLVEVIGLSVNLGPATRDAGTAASGQIVGLSANVLPAGAHLAGGGIQILPDTVYQPPAGGGCTKVLEVVPSSVT